MLTLQHLRTRLAGGCLACGLLAPGADAGGFATGTFDFTALVAAGPFAGTTAVGTCTYPEDAVFGTGESRLTPVEGLEIALTFLGQEFRELDDADYDLYPELWFQDGALARLNFYVSEQGDAQNPREIDAPGISNFWIRGTLEPEVTGSPGPIGAGDPAAAAYRVPLFINVPEPSGWGFALASGLGLGGFVLYRRRR